MPKVYILIGPAGVGKSTWVKNNLKEYSLISYDAVRATWGEERGLTYNEAFEKVDEGWVRRTSLEKYKLAMASGVDVVVDNTSLNKKSRRVWVDNINNDYELVGVYFDISEEENLRRLEHREQIDDGKYIPRDVIKTMRQSQTLPGIDEGFNYIIMVRD